MRKPFIALELGSFQSVPSFTRVAATGSREEGSIPSVSICASLSREGELVALPRDMRTKSKAKVKTLGVLPDEHPFAGFDPIARRHAASLSAGVGQSREANEKRAPSYAETFM